MPGGMPGMDGGDSPSGGGGMGMGMGSGMQGAMVMNNPNMVKVAKLVDVDKADGYRLAEQIIPSRLVVVTASFPFRKQLEEFRSKLKKHSLSELISLIGTDEASFEFRGEVRSLRDRPIASRVGMTNVSAAPQ